MLAVLGQLADRHPPVRSHRLEGIRMGGLPPARRWGRSVAHWPSTQPRTTSHSA